MRVDTAQFSVDTIECDICIIGAGPAGITIAREFAGSGLRVYLIESGDVGTSPYDTDSDGESVGHPYYRLSETRARAFGGTSHLWPEEGGLRSRPLDPIDFEKRPEVPSSGWPFDRDHLDPYYARAHTVCLLGDTDYAVKTWEEISSPRLPLEEQEIGTAIFKFTSDLDVFKNYRAELAAAPCLTVLLTTTALRLGLDPGGGRLDHVELRGPGNQKMVLLARYFILAAGAIENARLMLMSQDQNGVGIGNRHDLVGRYFMEHLRVRTGVMVLRDERLVEQLGLYRVHYSRGRKLTGALAIKPDTLRREGILNSVFYLHPSTRLAASGAYRSLSALRRAIRRDPWVRSENIGQHLWNVIKSPSELLDIVRWRLGASPPPKVVKLTCYAEQAPNPSSRVMLSTRRDKFGLPVAKLDWRLSDLDTYSIRRAQEALDRELRRSGIGHVERKLGDEFPEPLIRGNWHHIGTTRMHTNPRCGVVNQHCQVHDVENLYVAGSSVFPTGGYANPTLTIVALAIRLADHLKARAR